ncbi:hypothetical protein BJ165DRAFT_1571790 [Panaeolus papilionaceus]|nr:hypothetical protein BJ165DRAFT_1571790 [Panaeolus papilionaceus]
MSDETHYDYPQVLGPLRVEPVIPEELKGQRVRVCILMGPTGAGKSAFIEALAPKQGLSISKDTIDSVTQNIVCYNVVNLHDGGNPVVLMDTPGLLDLHMSESRVISMISSELDALRTNSSSVEMAVITLCYFHAIDVARMGRTKRSAVEFLKGFAQTFRANNVNIVTTMWNKLWNEKLATDAEQRFNTLQVEIYKMQHMGNVHAVSRVSLHSMSHWTSLTLPWHPRSPSSTRVDMDGTIQPGSKRQVFLSNDHLVLQGLMSRIQDAQLALELLPITEAKEEDFIPLYNLTCDLYQFDENAYRLLLPKAPCPPTFTPPKMSLIEVSLHKLSGRETKFFEHLASFMKRGTLVNEVGTAKARDSQSQVVDSAPQLTQAGAPVDPDSDPDLADTIAKLQYLAVIGDISVEPVTTDLDIPRSSQVVEALQAKSQDLQITRDQLASFTQTVVAYHVVNVLHSGCPIYLLDTPGFEDSLKSEMEIMSMIPAWMEQNGRLASSQQRTVEMLKGLLTATHDFDSVAVITTMWDMLDSEERRNRADSTFTRLSSDIFNRGRYQSLHEYKGVNTWNLGPATSQKSAFDVIGFTTAPHLYQELYQRIEIAVQEKQIIEDNLSHPEAKTNLDFQSILDIRLRKNVQLLDKFIEQFIEYGDPPAQFADDHQRLCGLVLSVRPELLDRLSPSSVTSSDNTTPAAAGDQTNGTPQSEVREPGLVWQDMIQIVDYQRPYITGIRRILGATLDRFKRQPGVKR